MVGPPTNNSNADSASDIGSSRIFVLAGLVPLVANALLVVVLAWWLHQIDYDLRALASNRPPSQAVDATVAPVGPDQFQRSLDSVQTALNFLKQNGMPSDLAKLKESFEDGVGSQMGQDSVKAVETAFFWLTCTAGHVGCDLNDMIAQSLSDMERDLSKIASHPSSFEAKVAIPGDSLDRIAQSLSKIESHLAVTPPVRGPGDPTSSSSVVVVNIPRYEAGARLVGMITTLLPTDEIPSADLVKYIVLPRVKAMTQDRTQCSMVVTGYTDTVGAESDNEQLARKRAEAISERITGELGFVSASTLVTRSAGERSLAKATADRVDEPVNRRVDIAVSCAPQ